MTALQKIQALLNANAAQKPYRIPARWDFFGFAPQTGEPEIQVDPRAFYSAAIDHLLSRPKAVSPPALYTMLPRFHTAYAHDKALESGTLLKTIALLPMLSDLGITLLCLLPIFVPSGRYRKGDLGSPYAIRDFFRIDPALHDPLLGAYDPETLELAFAALVEGAHHLGMRVLLDVALRTAARDHVWIGEHPEWFYWTRTEHVALPVIQRLPKSTPVSERSAHMLYAAPETKTYLAGFSPDPKTLDPARFAALPEPSLENIERAFSLTTAPAFSDVINDPQPLWTDVTFLRLDLGRNAVARAHLPQGHPPALLQDTIKLNVFPPGVRNTALEDELCALLPYWRSRFGIDGARLDMAHALHHELLLRIVQAAGEDFFLWSEAFSARDAARARQDGFDAVTGTLWRDIWAPGPRFHKRVLDPLLRCPLPSVAALETPDTPRAAQRLQGERLRHLWQFAALLPNTIPLINDGQELLERQPMNLGLDNTEQGRFVLDPADERYGKLAFFDHTSPHWLEENDAYAMLSDALSLRARFAAVLDKQYFFMSPRAHRHRSLTAFAYFDGKCLLLLMFLRRGKRRIISLRRYFPQKWLHAAKNAAQWFPEHKPLDAIPRKVALEPGELIVLSADLSKNAKIRTAT